MKKIVLLTNTIAPYRIPVLNKLNRIPDYQLKVWYLEEREKNRHWKIERDEIEYEYECLPGLHAFIQRLDMGVHWNPGIFFKLIRHRPDIVMTSGYDSLGYWAALLYSKMFRKKFVVWWGSTLASSRVKNEWVNRIRSFFFRAADSFVTYGTDSAECLKHYGVEERKIVVGYNTVDIRFFRDKYKEYVRRRGISRNRDEPMTFLFIGQLIERKGLASVIRSLHALKEREWQLLIVGTGPDEADLRHLIGRLGLEARIRFEGYKQKEEVVRYLIEADCLVFPSLIEVWGLVVNEALATDTFVLASKYAGATTDIIVDGHNGLIIDPLDEEKLTKSFEWILDRADWVRSERSLGLKLWRRLHPESYAKAVSTAIRRAQSPQGETI